MCGFPFHLDTGFTFSCTRLARSALELMENGLTWKPEKAIKYENVLPHLELGQGQEVRTCRTGHWAKLLTSLCKGGGSPAWTRTVNQGPLLCLLPAPDPP